MTQPYPLFDQKTGNPLFPFPNWDKLTPDEREKFRKDLESRRPFTIDYTIPRLDVLGIYEDLRKENSIFNRPIFRMVFKGFQHLENGRAVLNKTLAGHLCLRLLNAVMNSPRIVIEANFDYVVMPIQLLYCKIAGKPLNIYATGKRAKIYQNKLHRGLDPDKRKWLNSKWGQKVTEKLRVRLPTL